MIKAVIFDMDGVIINSEPYHIKSFKKLLRQEFKIDLAEEEVVRFLGMKDNEIIVSMLKHFHKKTDSKKFIEKRRNIYIKLQKNNLIPMPGLTKFLDLIKKNNYRIALASSSPVIIIDFIIDGLKIRKYFEFLVSGDHVKKGKPNPEIYLLAAKKLKLKPEQCIVIEDSVPGVIAAKEAGMKCIAMPNPYIKDGDFSRADMIINSLEELNLETIKSF